MIKRSLSTIVNAGLLLLLVSMFLLPVAMVHVASDMLSVPSSVAGVQAENSRITVLPNFFDFNEHVTFNPQDNGFGYADRLEITSFRSQLATYHKLYTVYNRSDEAVTVRGVIGEKPEPSVAYKRLVITLAQNGRAHDAVVVDDVDQGEISLVVSDASILENTTEVMIGNSVLPVLSSEGKVFTTDPLGQPVAGQTQIYRSGVLIDDGKVYRSRTGDVTLEPGESLSVNVYITGKSDVDSQPVSIPFILTTVEE